MTPVSKPAISYADACLDPQLFGPWFSADSWATWRVLDKALFGEPLDDLERAMFKELTGRDSAPTEPAEEAWIIAGRRSGKDVKAASIAVYLATIAAEAFQFQRYLAPGERGVVQLLAVDRNQATICLGYLKAMFQQRLFASLVDRELPDGLELTNRLAIEITTNDKRRVRGRTVVASVLDEIAFWLSDEGNTSSPDTAVYDALKPAMATIPGAMLIAISSPYARKGLLWKKYRAHYGQDGSTLVVKAPTWIMNPTLSRTEGFIAKAYQDDPHAAAAEFGAEFRSDVSGFIEYDVIDAVTLHGTRELEPRGSTTYFGFCDPSGGSKDAMTLGIAHLEAGSDTAVLDCLREIRPPFKPTDVVAEFCGTLRAYGISAVTGDRYAGEWVVSAFAEHGIVYEHSERSRSEIYLELLPALNSGSVQLLDNPRLLTQLVGLERRTSRTGRDTVDHTPGAHDDLANAAAGALVLAIAQRQFADEDGGVFRFTIGRRTATLRPPAFQAAKPVRLGAPPPLAIP